MNPPPRWFRGSLLAAVVLFVGGLLFLSAMGRDLNHDEHQFIAPGVLLSREGLLPYRDFPMFHLPNLTFIYAGLDRLTGEPVFMAKLLNVLATTAAVALIFLAGTTRRSTVPLLSRHGWFALAALTLLLCDQLFTYSTGKTWNHELPAFLLIAAILAFVRGVEKDGLGWLAASGFCVGLAIGTRLTYAPVALAFPILLLAAPLPGRRRGLGIFAWVGACAVSTLPSLYFFFADHDRFLFDNLQFPRLRLEDVTDTRVQKTMIWWRKLRFFGKEVIAHSLPLFVAFLASTTCFIRRWVKQRDGGSYGLLVTLVVLPLTILGCFLPSRYQYQHYFAVAPLLALAIAFSARTMSSGNRLAPIILLCATAFGLSPWNATSSKKPGGYRAYLNLTPMLESQNWFSTKLRYDYAFAKMVDGPVLTLAPTGVLNAGGRIYPEFATGPFAWRAAHLLSPEKRSRFGVVAPEDLERLLNSRPPAAILTGVEDETLEKPFITYATGHGFQMRVVTKRRTLWIRP